VVLYVAGAIVIGYIVIMIGIPLLEVIVALGIGAFSGLLTFIIPIVVIIALLGAVAACCSHILVLQLH
jgi:hypothetical protein